MQDTRMISLAARGAWMDLLCAMWRSQNRGQVTATMIGYARLFGCTVEQAEAVIAEIVDAQVCDSVTQGDGKVTLTNRRMLREAKERENANLRQKRYRRKERREGDADRNGRNNGKVTPPSSSSSSSATNVAGENPPDDLSQPDTMWRVGRQLLERSGMTKTDAGKLLGKLAKKHGQAELAAAIAKTLAANAANPNEYLVKVLNGHGPPPRSQAELNRGGGGLVL
jgi:uncharacterized protein YdaU (DUF1376 family)